jgi:hypothetical protein
MLVLLSASALMLSAAGAYAADSAKSATTKPAAKPRSAISLKCSADADAKGLHGKERKAFRKHCMKSAS